MNRLFQNLSLQGSSSIALLQKNLPPQAVLLLLQRGFPAAGDGLSRHLAGLQLQKLFAGAMVSVAIYLLVRIVWQISWLGS